MVLGTGEFFFFFDCGLLLVGWACFLWVLRLEIDGEGKEGEIDRATG